MNEGERARNGKDGFTFFPAPKLQYSDAPSPQDTKRQKIRPCSVTCGCCSTTSTPLIARSSHIL